MPPDSACTHDAHQEALGKSNPQAMDKEVQTEARLIDNEGDWKAGDNDSVCQRHRR